MKKRIIKWIFFMVTLEIIFGITAFSYAITKSGELNRYYKDIQNDIYTTLGQLDFELDTQSEKGIIYKISFTRKDKYMTAYNNSKVNFGYNGYELSKINLDLKYSYQHDNEEIIDDCNKILSIVDESVDYEKAYKAITNIKNSETFIEYFDTNNKLYKLSFIRQQEYGENGFKGNLIRVRLIPID